MNRRHSALTDWGLGHVTVRPSDTILDVGCGGGRTVAKLADAANSGVVYGIDYAEESVAAARRTNRDSIAHGRVKIEEASVVSLPFNDAMFDLVTAVETHFWWSDLHAGMRETFRVLKPGGRMVVVAEFYNGGKHLKNAKLLTQMTSIASLDVAEHGAMFVDAGFADVVVDENVPRGWICVVGEKQR